MNSESPEEKAQRLEAEQKAHLAHVAHRKENHERHVQAQQAFMQKMIQASLKYKKNREQSS